MIGRLHSACVYPGRVDALVGHLAQMLPNHVSILDVGCGDGLIDHRLLQQREDLIIRGVDVLIRPKSHIPVDRFDGTSLPYADGEFDYVMFVDVLHHTADPVAMLREASRVASKGIVLKDHTRTGLLARPTLRLMDYVGNARHGVVLPYNYLSRSQWQNAFSETKLLEVERREKLRLYGPLLDLVFGRRLHFVSLLTKSG